MFKSTSAADIIPIAASVLTTSTTFSCIHETHMYYVVKVTPNSINYIWWRRMRMGHRIYEARRQDRVDYTFMQINEP